MAIHIIDFWKEPATSHPLPPVIEHATFPFGLKTRIALNTIKTPAPRKIHVLFCERGMSQGNAESIVPIAAPPATVARAAGSAQHSNVLVDPNNAKKLMIFSFVTISIYFSFATEALYRPAFSIVLINCSGLTLPDSTSTVARCSAKFTSIAWTPVTFFNAVSIL